MSKTIFKAILGVLFLSSLSLQPAAGAKARGNWNSAEVKQVSEDLKSALARIQDYKTKRDQAQEDLETKILGTNDRLTTDNEAAMDAAIVDNYSADARDDISCLRDNWENLSAGEKSLVNRAMADLIDTE